MAAWTFSICLHISQVLNLFKYYYEGKKITHIEIKIYSKKQLYLCQYFKSQKSKYPIKSHILFNFLYVSNFFQIVIFVTYILILYNKLSIMKQQLKKTKRDPIIQNFENLADTLNRVQSKNIAKYNQIKRMNPEFEFKLYKPIIHSFSNRLELGLAEEIMLRQMDKLMEDEERLNLELSRHQIKFKEQEKKKERQIMLSMDHFTFLRKLWKKDQSQSGTDSKVDKLIHNVGAIKGHILNIIKKQNQTSHSIPQIHELAISSPQYCQLLKNYEELKQSYKTVQEKRQLTNSTSQCSSENEDVKRYNEELEEELASLKIELANKTIMLENMKMFQSKLFEKEVDGGSQSKKIGFYRINSHTKAYNIYIEQIQRKCKDNDQNSNETDRKQIPTKQFTSQQSLESILKFLQGGSEVRRGFKSTQKFSDETRPRKFTVEQIMKPKFISNRNMSHKSPQHTNITTQ